MHEDRCRHKWLQFMGALTQEGYYVTEFSGNNNYDFIDVMYPIFDGLEPNVQGWIHSNIAISLIDNSVHINEGMIKITDNTYPFPLWIVNATISQFTEFVNEVLPEHV